MKQKRLLEITKGRIILTGTLILLVTIFMMIAMAVGTPLENWSIYFLAVALIGGTIIETQIVDFQRPGSPVKKIPDGDYTVVSDIIVVGLWKMVALNEVVFDGRLIGASAAGDFLNQPTLVDYTDRLEVLEIKIGDKIKIKGGFMTKLPPGQDFSSS
jgi:hypothetical protein